MKIKNMRQFLVDEFSKFKIEVVELIQYVSKFKTLTMNICKCQYKNVQF